MPSAIRRAVVLGGSAAGLLAARALADHAANVVVLERDELPDAAEHRKGTPQSRHANNLMAGAAKQIEAWFPGITDELVGLGATPETGATMHFWLSGQALPCGAIEQATLFMTRPLLDEALRKRLRAMPNVTFVTGRDVVGLRTASDDRAPGHVRVVGVHARRRDDHTDERIDADLVVDAMGRGSKGLEWLAELGFEAPPETKLDLGLRYATRTFRRAPGVTIGSYFITPTSELARGGVAFAVEGDRWIVSLFGYRGDAPPVDLEGFAAWAATLAAPQIARLVRSSEPAGDGVSFGVPTVRLRHFERPHRKPRGYVALGDAICNLNPSYGQGITSATWQAEALAAALSKGARDAEARFYRLALPRVQQLFEMNWSGDARWAGYDGPATPLPAILRWYLQRFERAAARDLEVCRALRRLVVGLTAPPSVLRPSVLARVFWYGGRSGESSAPTTPVVEQVDQAAS